MQMRKNRQLSNIIEQGIAIETAKGAAQAWAFLTFNQIPRPVIARVLAASARRRASDTAAAKTRPALEDA